MFSNSVTVPAGTFREAASEAEDSLSSPPCTSSVLASSDKKSKYLIGKFLLLYLIKFQKLNLTKSGVVVLFLQGIYSKTNFDLRPQSSEQKKFEEIYYLKCYFKAH